MPPKGAQRVAAHRLEDILACAPACILDDRANALKRVARRLGLSPAGLRYHIASVEELIRQLCLRHLNEAFDAVCLPADWHGTPIEVLRAMGLALLAYAEDHPARHLVFLLHRHSLEAPERNALDTLLAYLTHNFQLALHAMRPEHAFDSLLSPARMFLGQILHLPLWWPEETHGTKDEWLCAAIGQLAGTAPPDWQAPPARRTAGEGPSPWPCRPLGA